MNKYFFLLLAATLAIACSSESNSNRIPVATVYDKTLYLDEVQAILPKEIAKADSITKTNAYIDIWIRQQLIIKKAELSLSAQEKDVEKQLNDYRNSLIVFKFQEKFINEKLDTVVSENDIESFYREHSQEFILNSNIVKALLVRIPKDLPDLSQIRSVAKATNSESVDKLAELCKKNAISINFFDDKWIPFTSLLMQTNYKVENPEEFLHSQRSFEIIENNVVTIVKIREMRFINDLTPISMVKDNIKGIVLTKRKNALISDLEKSLYDNALQNSNIKYLNSKDKTEKK